MKNSWINYIIAYAMWMVFTLVGFVFLLISRQDILGILYNNSHENYLRTMQAQLIDKVYLLVVGLAIFVLSIFVEEYFKKGVKKGILLIRVSKVMGLETLFLFVAHLMLVVLGLIGAVSGLQILLMAIEFLIGAGLFWIGIRPRVKPKTIQK